MRTIILISLILFRSLNGQNLTLIGDVNNYTFSILNQSLNKSKIKLEQFKIGDNKTVKIKQLNSNLISNNPQNIEDFKRLFENYQQNLKSVNSANTVFILIDKLDNQTSEKIVGSNKSVIYFKDFVSDLEKYKKSKNILLLVPSRLSISGLQPTNRTSISDYNFKFSLSGESNYQIKMISIKFDKKHFNIDIQNNLEWNPSNGEFNVSEIIELNEVKVSKKMTLQITITTQLGDSLNSEIKNISVEKAFVRSILDFTGEIIPEIYDGKAYYVLDIESNIVFDEVEIQFFDNNKKPYSNKKMIQLAEVLNCDAGRKIILLNPDESPVVWTIMNTESENNLYSTTISDNYRHPMCDYYWEGFLKVSLQGTNYSSEMVKVKLPGFNPSEKSKFELVECN